MYPEPSAQTFMFRARPSPSCDSECVKIQLHWHVEKPDEAILPVDCRVFHVCVQKFICLLTRLSEGTVFGRQPSPLASSVVLRPCHRFAPLSPDKTCYIVTTWFYRPKSSERKCTCLVGDLCKTIGILSTIYKVGFFLFWMLCEIAQRSCRDRSSWAYLFDPRSGTHYSCNSWTSRLWR